MLDLNADGIQDIAVLVRLSNATIDALNRAKQLASIVSLCGAPAPCDEELKLSDSALLVLHGKTKGWHKNNDSPFDFKQAFLLRGRDNVLAFQQANFDSLEPSIRVKKSKNGRYWLELATEASEGILQWRSGRYSWRETEP